MGVEKVVVLEDKTVFSIEELKPYGEPDKSWEVSIPHDSSNRANLATISKETFLNPNRDPRKAEGEEEMQSFEVPQVGTVVFIKTFDNEWSAAKYRSGAHDVSGPYLLEPYF